MLRYAWYLVRSGKPQKGISPQQECTNVQSALAEVDSGGAQVLEKGEVRLPENIIVLIVVSGTSTSVASGHDLDRESVPKNKRTSLHVYPAI